MTAYGNSCTQGFLNVGDLLRIGSNAMDIITPPVQQGAGGTQANAHLQNAARGRRQSGDQKIC